MIYDTVSGLILNPELIDRDLETMASQQNFSAPQWKPLLNTCKSYSTLSGDIKMKIHSSAPQQLASSITNIYLQFSSFPPWKIEQMSTERVSGRESIMFWYKMNLECVFGLFATFRLTGRRWDRSEFSCDTRSFQIMSVIQVIWCLVTSLLVLNSVAGDAPQKNSWKDLLFGRGWGFGREARCNVCIEN